MGSLKKLNNERKKANSITKEELEVIQKDLRMKEDLNSRIGQLELQKLELANRFGMVENHLNKHLTEIKEKYGDVRINPEDGTFVPNEKPDAVEHNQED